MCIRYRKYSINEAIKKDLVEPIQVEPIQPMQVKPMQPIQVQHMQPTQVEPLQLIQVEPLQPIQVEPMQPMQTITGGASEPKEPIHKANLKKYIAHQNQSSNLNLCKLAAKHFLHFELRVTKYFLD